MVLRRFLLEQLQEPDAATLAGLDAALRDPGALRIVGGREDHALTVEMDAATRTFFERPLEEKAALRFEADPYVGWCGDRYLAELGSQDRKEMFHVGPRVAPTLGAHDAGGHTPAGQPADAAETCPLWPAAMDFIDVWHRYYRRMQVMAVTVGRALAQLLELDEAEWFGVLGGNWADLAANYYSPLEATDGQPVYNAAHSDLTVFTILYQDDSRVGGLSVQSADGSWSAVDPEPDTYICNAGELLTYLSGGRWRAAPHRVTVSPAEVAPSRARVSIPFFYRPSDHAVVRSFADPSAETIPVGEWVAERKRRSLMRAD